MSHSEESKMTERERAEGHLQLDGWAGRTSVAVEVVGMTRTRYRIMAIEDTKLPRRWLRKGQTALVPQYAVRFTTKAKEVLKHERCEM